ncbi:MAG: hypothetical protein J0I47_06755 [Sphingomonas sp.]|uniref:hypothetical protein n=1 Tax=Sphingomonas sp. TaxID=28214 RepID=UPI001AC4632C|nr:hypothetical protein [Sphingomonas sp.]MBN8807920.1 hypothetical protein [Sphingomonas sp.]
MTDPTPTQSRNRYFAMVFFRLLGAAGAVFGIILIGRYDYWPTKILGTAIVLSAIYMAYTVPAALAHRWATPGNLRTHRRQPKK